MSDVKVSIESRNKEDHPLVASLLAILLVVLCLWASVWQFNRGTARHELNSRIASHISQGPTSLEKTALNIDDAEWRKISIEGTFDSSHQILLRNRYSEGKYGFDLLTLFSAKAVNPSGLIEGGLLRALMPHLLPGCRSRQKPK